MFRTDDFANIDLDEVVFPICNMDKYHFKFMFKGI